MNFKFIGEVNEINQGLKILAKRLGFILSEDGAIVRVIKREGNLQVVSDGKSAEIRYDNKIHFFRALGILKEHWGSEFKICEEPKFDKNGLMIDASRNGVMKPDTLKEFMEIMAVMGLNFLMMYTEDTYEVPEYPYFGYMRGRYTCEELQMCDDYAEIFGIEMIPCIQTLAHLSKALKWNHGLKINDTEDSLMVGEEDTYTFIRNLLKAATKPYRSKRVHIGMDEAWTLGLGAYLRKNGYRTPSLLIKEHFAKVKEICDELGIEVIMWSDMFFRACSDNNEYYNVNVQFTDEILNSVPKDVGLIYWDYYNTDETTYDLMIKRHKELGEKTIFAGGIWVWGKMNVNYKNTFDVTIPGLRACIKNNVREVFATMWGDNSNQTNAFEALLGMQLYAEMGYGHEPEMTFLDKRFRACTGESAEAFIALSSLDNLGQEGYVNANPSEYLLWQDVLIGLLDSHVDRSDISEIYKERKEVLKMHMENSEMCKDVFAYAYHLANVLEIKADLGVRLKKSYDSKNLTELRELCMEVLPELEKRVIEFKKVFRKLWFSNYKPFGYEIIDMRFGSLLGRLETAQLRIKQYLNGEVGQIEELEPERLPYDIFDGQYGEGLNLRTLTYNKYISAGYCSHGYYD